MDTTLLLGVAKVEITPPKPVPLAGYAFRSGPYEAVDQPLYARIFYFRSVNGNGTVRDAAVLSADLIWWGSDRVPQLKRTIREATGCPEEYILLHATHTHSGPQTSDRFVPSLGRYDPDYVAFLEVRVLQGIVSAAGNLEPVTVERGMGTCSIGMSRRLPLPDRWAMLPNPYVPVDREAIVVKFSDVRGRAKGAWVHFACHPVISNGNRLTSDFAGVAVSEVETALAHGGDSPVVAYLQGCCGDINPGSEGKFCFGDDTIVRRMGGELAQETLRLLETPLDRLQPTDLSARTLTVSLPHQPLPSAGQLEEHLAKDDVRGEWSRLLSASPERIQPRAPLELTLLKVAEGLSLLAMNAEVVDAYGQFVKRSFGQGILPLPYTNGMLGYVVTSRQAEEGGYEAEDSAYYFGLPAPFDRAAEQLVREGILALVEDGKSIEARSVRMLIDQYFEYTKRVMETIERTQKERIEQVAAKAADSIAQGGVLHVFGSGHSHIMAEELFHRAGGLACVNAMLEPSLMELNTGRASQLERLSGYAEVLLGGYDLRAGEVLIVVSNSGINAVPIEMAMEGKKRGLYVVALTSMDHTKRADSRHPTGKKLYEVADATLDNCGVYGDAAIAFDEAGGRTGPVSTLAGVLIVQALHSAIVEALQRRGFEPPVFRSDNQGGSELHNRRFIERYKGRIRYL